MFTSAHTEGVSGTATGKKEEPSEHSSFPSQPSYKVRRRHSMCRAGTDTAIAEAHLYVRRTRHCPDLRGRRPPATLRRLPTVSLGYTTPSAFHCTRNLKKSQRTRHTDCKAAPPVANKTQPLKGTHKQPSIKVHRLV